MVRTAFLSWETGALPLHVQQPFILCKTDYCLWTLSDLLEAFYKVKLNLGCCRIYTVKRCQVSILRISNRNLIYKEIMGAFDKSSSLSVALELLVETSISFLAHLSSASPADAVQYCQYSCYWFCLFTGILESLSGMFLVEVKAECYPER